MKPEIGKSVMPRPYLAQAELCFAPEILLQAEADDLSEPLFLRKGGGVLETGIVRVRDFERFDAGKVCHFAAGHVADGPAGRLRAVTVAQGDIKGLAQHVAGQHGMTVLIGNLDSLGAVFHEFAAQLAGRNGLRDRRR